MYIEKSVDIRAPQQRSWDVLSDLEAWPRWIDTVESVEVLTPGSVSKGGRVRLKQPKLGVTVWEITVWDPPVYFEFRSESRGMTSVVGHNLEATKAVCSRLTLTVEMRGLLAPVAALFSKGMTARYLMSEAQDMKRAIESLKTNG